MTATVHYLHAARRLVARHCPDCGDPTAVPVGLCVACTARVDQRQLEHHSYLRRIGTRVALGELCAHCVRAFKPRESRAVTADGEALHWRCWLEGGQ